MAEKFTYRLYEPGDEAGICKLFSEVFMKNMTLEHWEWKYRNGLFGEALNMVCVNTQGEIVGHFGAQPLPFQSGGRRYKAAQLMDGMLKKEYRAKGVYLELCRVFFKICDDAGFKLLFGFPSERMYYVVCLAGFYLVDEIHRFTKVLDAPAPVDSPQFPLLDSDGKNEKSRKLMEQARRYFNRAFFKAREMTAGDPRVARIWKSFQESCPCSLERTQQYLHWRFDLHPDYRYLKVGVFPRWGGPPQSFYIARVTGDVAYLVECFSRRPRSLLWSAGLDKLELFLARLGVNRVAIILPTWHPVSGILQKQGYEPTLEGRITARLGYGASEEMTRGWFYTYGDHDDF